MPTWLIEPLDTLFFREGRAFEKGEAAHVSSVFPPPPTALQGMLRSRLLAEHCGRWANFQRGCKTDAGQPCEVFDTCQVRDVVGQRDSARVGGARPGTLECVGPWVVVEASGAQRWLLPTPLDIVASSDALRRGIEPGQEIEPDDISVLAPTPAGEPARCSLPPDLRRLVPDNDGPPDWDFAPVRGWMAWDSEGWEAYLAGCHPVLRRGETWFTDSDLWGVERRPGVEINRDSQRAEEGNLYFAQHHRTQHQSAGRRQAGGKDTLVRLGCECRGVPDALMTPGPQGLRVAFGGEMRAAVLRRAGPTPWSSSRVKNEVHGKKCLKVVLVQPAYFADGWRPPATGAFAGLTLVAAAVDRQVPTGGWDLAARREKKVRPFVPARSVYYFEAGSVDIDNLWNVCVSETPTDEGLSLESIGYGHAFAGTWGTGADGGVRQDDDGGDGEAGDVQ